MEDETKFNEDRKTYEEFYAKLLSIRKERKPVRKVRLLTEL